MRTALDLLNIAAQMGVHVAYRDRLNGDADGAWVFEHNTIYLAKRLTEPQTIATLAHELIHARRGDTGRCDRRTEAHIDEKAAWLILTRTDYAALEITCDGDLYAMADEAGLPVWIMEAARRSLTRTHVRTPAHA